MKYILGIVIVGFLGLVAWAGVESAKEWEDYKATNHCREAGYVSGSSSVGPGVGANGNVTVVSVYTPGKTRWLCDNDIEIYR